MAARVLVVEDHPANQRVILTQLQHLGLESEAVDNGLEAVERAATGGFDLILMDVQLPLLNGYEAARQIRAAESPGERVQIIAVTAGAQAGEEARCREAGMDGILRKPVRLSELQQVLENGIIASVTTRRILRLDARVWRDLFEQSRATDPGLLADIGAQFRQEGPHLLAAALAARAAGQSDEARRSIHRLAGVAGTLGLARLAHQARQAEDGHDPAWKSLPGEMTRTLEVLQEALAGLDAPSWG